MKLLVFFFPAFAEASASLSTALVSWTLMHECWPSSEEEGLEKLHQCLLWIFGVIFCLNQPVYLRVEVLAQLSFPLWVMFLCRVWIFNFNLFIVREKKENLAQLLTRALSWAHCLRRVLFPNLYPVIYELSGVAAGLHIHNVRVESSMAQEGWGSHKQDCYLCNWL